LLTKFILEFEQKVGEWRQNEAEADFACAQGKPPLLIQSSVMLQQAAQFYTHKLYKLFQKEFMNILVSSIQEVEVVDESTFCLKVIVKTKWS
jgi:hypothetical protein